MPPFSPGQRRLRAQIAANTRWCPGKTPDRQPHAAKPVSEPASRSKSILTAR
ncbi:MAG: hypothetical protein JO281_08870 [Pseudonocardiales bacterium]|nr:hypothetical protein [Pseudonocardiales bacterium]